MRRLGRGLAACLVFTSIVATRPARLQAACATGIIASPQGNLGSVVPTTSADGRYTAFHTQTNLIPADTNNQFDVYVIDRLTCALEVVSRDQNDQQGFLPASYGSISGDGRYVAFMSPQALVPNDGNIADDVFVRDRVANTLVRLSNNYMTGVAAGGLRPKVSADGTTVAWVSASNVLVPGDTNGLQDVFIAPVGGGTIERVSLANGGIQATGTGLGVIGLRPALSADARYVAFATDATNMVPGDTNNALDVYRYDRQTQTAIRASVSSNGTEGDTSAAAQNPALSADGRCIVFEYYGQHLVPGNVEAPSVYLHDAQLHTTVQVNVPAYSGMLPVASRPSISADGRYVTFVGGSGFVAGDTNNLLDVFVKDMQTGAYHRASARPDGVEGNLSSPNTATVPDISGDGLIVAFDSFANNLVSNDTNLKDDVFIVEWKMLSAPPNADLVRNGNFTGGTNTWFPFATPDLTYIDYNVTSGVFQFNRLAPPPGTTNQAVVLQDTTAQLQPGSPLVATFQLGNSSTARRRVSVLLHDSDFTDLFVCTFWLPPVTALQTYTMRTHTTKRWFGATVSVYAATPGADGGFNRLDNVTLRYVPGQPDDETACVDPLAPAATGGGPDPNVIANGDFGGGIAGWALFGQITSQIVGGVFEFFRPSGTPAGVIFQNTGQPVASGQIVTASFALGNTSAIRKRVTVLLQEADFSDLSACTFWLPPATALQSYTMRSYTTKAWTNATLSVYPATVGVDPWIQLDDVVMQRTPGSATVGTQCLEPSSGLAPHLAQVARTGGVAGGSLSAGASLSADRPSALSRHERPGGNAIRPTISYRIPPGDAPLAIQTSADREDWVTLLVVEPSDDWRVVTIAIDQLPRNATFVRVVR